MIVGDLVRQRQRLQNSNPKCSIDEVGIIIEVDYPSTNRPDYRTPTAVLVFYGSPQVDGGKMKQEIWFHKSELEMIHEAR